MRRLALLLPILDWALRYTRTDAVNDLFAAAIVTIMLLPQSLQFSAAADVEPLWQRIADATLRAVSIGYRVHRYDQRPDPVSGEMIYRAVDREPFEISIVPIPVNRDAQVLGAAPQGTPSFASARALGRLGAGLRTSRGQASGARPR
jgi:hypothetical protein